MIVGSFLVIFLLLTVTKRMLEKEDAFETIEMEGGYGKPSLTISMRTFDEDAVLERFGRDSKSSEFSSLYEYNHTWDLHNSTVECLKDLAMKAGDNPLAIDNCMRTIGDNMGQTYWVPCVAEKAIFRYYTGYVPYGSAMGEIDDSDRGKMVEERCWIFLLITAHSNCIHKLWFVISAEDYSPLFCYG